MLLVNEVCKQHYLELVMCTVVPRVYKTLYILIKGYTVPGNQAAHEKLDQIHLGKLKRVHQTQSGHFAPAVEVIN